MALVFVAAASSAFANTPSVPPPDLDRLAVAQLLVAALPLEAAVGNGFSNSELTSEVADNTVAWCANQPSQRKDVALKSFLYANVRIESHASITAAIGDSGVPLVEVKNEKGWHSREVKHIFDETKLQ
jgi:hypothetical protein